MTRHPFNGDPAKGPPARAGFYRIWRMPRRCWRGADLWRMTPRGQHLYQRSRERFARRPDAYLPSLEPLRGEIGVIESFRFITSTALA